jgi:ice-binding like protein
MHGHTQRFKMMTLVLLVALIGCGKGVRNRKVLPGSMVTELGLTQVATDPGESAGTAVSGYFTVDAGSGTVMATTSQGCPATAQTQSDLTLMLDEAARLGSIVVSDIPGGQTLAPGVYEFTYFLEISSADLTLDVLDKADAAMIVQFGSMLTDTHGCQVILSGPSRASNLFCRAGSTAALGSISVFQGNLPPGQSKKSETGKRLDENTLAWLAAVTLKTHSVGPR